MFFFGVESYELFDYKYMNFIINGITKLFRSIIPFFGKEYLLANNRHQQFSLQFCFIIGPMSVDLNIGKTLLETFLL